MVTQWLLPVAHLRTIVGLVCSLLILSCCATFVESSAAQQETPLPASTQLPLPTPQVQPQPDPFAVRIDALKQSNQRWIQVILSRQRLIAWDGKTPVYAVIVSTGKPGMETPVGIFAIQVKLDIARMRGADYDIDNIPYTMYYDGNYAIHGAYWHHKFGTPVSHGCINVAVDHAQWLFKWAKIGTPVVVQK